jgi:myo-inositol 2-dehydrogenase / D-chiro-inositol 1-dehydrogenase
MQEDPNIQAPVISRRDFIKTSSVAAVSAAAAVNFPSIASAQSKQPIRAVIIGVGGRGSGAGENFNEAVKNLGIDGKIVGVADMFPEAATKAGSIFNVPEQNRFSGFDAYQKAIEVPGVNYCILATPPGFRAPHFKACVAAGKNVFMEKPVAVDAVGIRMVYEAADEAKKKNLKVAAGTQRRHRPSYIETVKRIQDGAIGDVRALRVYWVNGGPIWHRGDHGQTDLERQIRNWYHYIWLCGDHICEQHVHNLDIANWIMNDHPVKCWGMGARQQLDAEHKSGEIWDNFAVEYEYPNGVRMHAYCGQIKRSWSSVSEAVAGATGAAEMHDGRNFIRPRDGKVWRPTGIKEDNGYVNEHRDLIEAILNDKPLNEAKQVADTTFTAIIGREAAYSGAEVEWDTAFKSDFHYGPDQLFQNCASMQFGPFRTLQPPMPSQHNIFKSPPEIVVAKA